MKEKLLIVDGYNVIRNHERYKKTGLKDLEGARVKLAEDLTNLAALTEAQIVLVFDGSQGDSASLRKTKVFHVEVWFSGQERTADDVIEKLVFQARGERKIIVASSDYALQKTVFGEGVLRQSPRELVSEIAETKKEAMNSSSVAKGRKRIFVEDQLREEIRKTLRDLI